MFRDVTPQMAGLVGCWCNAVLYGITIVAYAVCMYVLIKQRNARSQTATWVLISTSTIQFMLSTIFVALSLRSLIECFILTKNVHDGALLYWINPAIKSRSIARFVSGTNFIVGDSALIWRVYMVWGKNIYVCTLPIIITCMTTVTAYVAGNKLIRFSGNPQPTTEFEILNWILATWCLSMASQVISTSLIAGRIWWYAPRNPETKSRYLPVIAIVVESGAIYTVSTVFLLVFADLKAQASAIVGYMLTHIATIVPTLIIIRVGLNRSMTTSTLRRSDLAHKEPQCIVFFSPPQQSDLSVQDTVSTLPPSCFVEEPDSTV